MRSVVYVDGAELPSGKDFVLVSDEAGRDYFLFVHRGACERVLAEAEDAYMVQSAR